MAGVRGSQELRLRAAFNSGTKMDCFGGLPCCNACMTSRWRPAAGWGALKSAGGHALKLGGIELPNCGWPAGQCGCDYDLVARGTAKAGVFVVERYEQVPNPQARTKRVP